MELRPPVAFQAVIEQEFNLERPLVGAVSYQALLLLQMFIHNIRVGEV